MKLLTLNTHSLAEPDYGPKLHSFVLDVLRRCPDVIALQEVNQTIAAPAAGEPFPGYHPCPGAAVPLKTDNHALAVARLLRLGGQAYYWTWLPVKVGYGRYDEGLALFSRAPITAADNFRISAAEDYGNWKTRRVLGIRTGGPSWYYCAHMGWWQDAEEPFAAQWQRLCGHLRAQGGGWLLGDFNSDAAVRGEGYDLICASGWQDTWKLAQKRDSGYTVEQPIDGWRDAPSAARLRLDYIWASQPRTVLEHQVVYNGRSGPRVSDHAGVLAVIQ